jgi:putative ABC transport system permease protein
VLVFLVLLIACGNVANLMTALAASRAREMALRVAIGAGRLRLMQMVMVESAMLGLMAAGLGSVFAWWAAPMVVRLISPASNPARLALPADVRVLMVGLLLILAVILLFGLAPALRASAMPPTMALKGGEEPQAKRRSMHALVAAQTAFCFLVLFLAGLFAVTFHRLLSQPMGFEAKGLLLLETQSPHGQTPEAWAQMGEQLRAMPGVTDVAESGWPLLSTGSWNGSISVNGGPPSMTLGYFFTVSPGWIDTMKMHLLEGRAIAATDTFPGEAVVNERFVKDFFQGQDPLGKTFEKTGGGAQKLLCRVVGVVADTPYRYLREERLPAAFVPYREVDDKGIVGKESNGTFLVRTTASDPMAMAAGATAGDAGSVLCRGCAVAGGGGAVRGTALLGAAARTGDRGADCAGRDGGEYCADCECAGICNGAAGRGDRVDAGPCVGAVCGIAAIWGKRHGDVDDDIAGGGIAVGGGSRSGSGGDAGDSDRSGGDA